MHSHQINAVMYMYRIVEREGSSPKKGPNFLKGSTSADNLMARGGPGLKITLKYPKEGNPNPPFNVHAHSCIIFCKVILKSIQNVYMIFIPSGCLGIENTIFVMQHAKIRLFSFKYR